MCIFEICCCHQLMMLTPCLGWRHPWVTDGHDRGCYMVLGLEAWSVSECEQIVE